MIYKYYSFPLMMILMMLAFSVMAEESQELNRATSSCPDHHIEHNQTPQFVVLSFDDNTTSSGIEWALDLFADKQNPVASNNPATFDASQIKTSFYTNTLGLIQWQEDDPDNLAKSISAIYKKGHEIANHTHNHHHDLANNKDNSMDDLVAQLSKESWVNRIQQCTDLLVQKSGIPKGAVVGFRAPYLLHTLPMLNAVRDGNFLYDSSIEEGYDAQFDGTNFRWPYRLGDENNESKVKFNSSYVKLPKADNLWEMPNYVLLIPADDQAEIYQFEKGLREKVKANIPYMENYRMTGFDYNLWVKAKLNKSEVLAILKYNLDLHLQGNRAPFTFGMHSQYYTNAKWSELNAPQVNINDMQETIRLFIEYALTKPEVRIRPASDVIQWCKRPVALGAN